jgi:regulator of protease activity HflC (stomatin/prohibitin superfamily)
MIGKIRLLGNAIFKGMEGWLKSFSLRNYQGLIRSITILIILILIGILAFGWWMAPISMATFLFVLLVLAPLKINFTFVEESSAQAVMRGGQFKKFLIAWADHTFRKTTEGKQSTEAVNWEVVKGRERFHLFGGLRMYSWQWPLERIIAYEQTWIHLHDDGKIKMHEKEVLRYVLLALDLYVIEYSLSSEDKAEDIDGVPIGVQVILPMQIVNPYVALFVVQSWLGIITGVVKASLRPFFARYRYREDLLGLQAGKGIEEKQEEAGVPADKRAKEGEDIRQKMFEEIGAALARRAREEGAEVQERKEGLYIFGVLIKKEGMDLLNIEPDPAYREATTIKYRAEREREKTIIDADAYRRSTIARAEGDKERIEKVFGKIKEFGDLGRLLRALESIEKSPLAASLSVQAIPGLQDVLKGVFGKQPEMVTRQEFRELRELVEEIIKKKDEGR